MGEPSRVRRIRQTVGRRAATFRREIGVSYRDGGLPGALAQGVRLVGELIARPVRRWHERRLDRRLHIDTRADRGSTGPADAFDDAVPYSPIPVHHFRTLVRALPITDPRGFAFLDLGCGKGRTLILAAGHGFDPVIGVELDDRLAAVARVNAATRPGITVVTTDAVDYTFPALPTVLFLFNPFGADTLAAVVANVERSLKETPRRVVVAYFNPVHRTVLDHSPAFRPRSQARNWTIHESVA